MAGIRKGESKKLSGRSTTMPFIITGFTQDMGFRVYAFERTEKRIRTKFTVRADLALIQRYGIRLQDLPLVCRGILERHNEGEEQRTLIFTEDEMCLYATNCVAARDAAAQKRKPSRRPRSGNVGSGWRVPQ